MPTTRSELAPLWTLDPNVVHLNHGSFGACPRVVLEEQSRLRALLEADPMAFYFDVGPRLWQGALEALAAFLHADPQGLTLQPNATTGVNTVLRSFALAPGDEIVVIDHAYQACRNAVDAVCARAGARAVTVALPFPPQSEDELVARIVAAVGPRTRLVMFDTVTSPTAIRLPFERLTREVQALGADVLLDAAHGPGIVPLNLDALGAAYVAGNCHKWLCTPKGSAFLWVRADRRAALEPLVVSHGWSAQVPPEQKFRLQFDWPGTQDTTPWLCIPKAIEYLGGLMPGGWPAVMERNRALALRAHALLADALGIERRVPDALLASMATLAIAPDPNATFTTVLAGDPLMRELHARHRIQTVVFAWPAHGARYLRVSAALYNTEDEYRRLAQALRAAGVSG